MKPFGDYVSCMAFLLPVIFVMHLPVLFNPGPYAGYLAMVLPICLHHYIHFGGWKWISTSLKLEKVAAGIVGVLILCVLPATMSRSAWIAAGMGCMMGNLHTSGQL
ncbi:MAG: hypothetical protein ACLUE2_13390 [Bacteroides cellulosilyticus]